MSTQHKVRCRQIEDADLATVAAVLERGFPARPRAYWERGLQRLARRDVPAGYPRFGYLLEQGGVVRGALLLIAAACPGPNGPTIRCNLSSWCVDPAFRGHAAALSRMATRHREATFVNVSAAPNTWATVEAFGFTRYTKGQLFAFPVLARGAEPGLTVEPYDPATALPEAKLMADHAATGCLTLVGHAPDGPQPFVFLPLRVRQGRVGLPGVQLVYARTLTAVARFAAPLGRHLLWRGRPLMVLDADAAVPGLTGWFWRDRARKYFKGPQRPRLGDLAYTEFTIFGA